MKAFLHALGAPFVGAIVLGCVLAASGSEARAQTYADCGAGCGNLALGKTVVGSSRVDLQACKLEYSIVSPK